MGRLLWLAMLGMLALAGCGGSSSTAKATPSPSTHISALPSNIQAQIKGGMGDTADNPDGHPDCVLAVNAGGSVLLYLTVAGQDPQEAAQACAAQQVSQAFSKVASAPVAAGGASCWETIGGKETLRIYPGPAAGAGEVASFCKQWLQASGVSG